MRWIPCCLSLVYAVRYQFVKAMDLKCLNALISN